MYCMYVYYFLYNTVAALPQNIASEHQVPATLFADKGIFVWMNYIHACVCTYVPYFIWTWYLSYQVHVLTARIVSIRHDAWIIHEY